MEHICEGIIFLILDSDAERFFPRILNGAQQGVAGFGLAVDPILTALLYDPTQPKGSRFSILNSTIVDRLYHSEAILLQDGRVLVSGSDPNPDGGPFLEEYRVEVYVPPYLAQGQVQPTFNITNTDWNYGQSVQISHVTLHTTAAPKISLLAAVSSTHGNSFVSSRQFLINIFIHIYCRANALSSLHSPAAEPPALLLPPLTLTLLPQAGINYSFSTAELLPYHNGSELEVILPVLAIGPNFLDLRIQVYNYNGYSGSDVLLDDVVGYVYLFLELFTYRHWGFWLPFISSYFLPTYHSITFLLKHRFYL